jgi:type VI secretion system protein VasJ
MTYREEVAERMAPLIAPFPGANPAGADIQYEADFEAVKAEVDKLSSVDNLEPAWGRIEQLGAGLLGEKGKDLRIVSWLTVAKVKNGSWKGFAESLVLFHALASQYWDTMYPEARRARARVNAIAWMADMVHATMEKKDVTLADADAVRTCDEVLNELDRIFAEKLADAYAGPGRLRTLMRDKVAAIPVPPPEPVPGQETTEAAPTPEQAAPAAPTTPEEVDGALLHNTEIIVGCANVLRAADPTNARAYALNRRGAWLMVNGSPPSDGGRIVLDPPDPGMVAELEAMRSEARWAELLEAAETKVPQYLFWLDAHRLVATAMDNLGPAYAAAREVVGRDLAAYLASLPDVPNLAFNDGTPVADGVTQNWLAEELPRWGTGGASVAAAAISKEDEEIAARFEEAKKLVLEGKVADGLAIGVGLADRSADARLRFRARLSVGKMALDAAKHDLARGMLEHLLGEVERHGLETWEPAACATLYAYLLTATREVSRAKGGSPDLEARGQILFDKLCRLDPASAIRLST